MTYKIQIGDARLSGSVVFEGDVEASSSSVTGSNLSLSNSTSIAGSGLSDSAGRLTISSNAVTHSMISGSISTSKLLNSSMNIAGITSTLGGSEPSASAVASAIDSEPMAITNIQDLDVFAFGDLTIFNSITDSLTIATSSTDVEIAGNLVTKGDVSIIESEFLTSDNYITINSNYTADTPISGGLIMVVKASEIISGSFAIQPQGFAFGGMYIQEITPSFTTLGTFTTGDLLFVRDRDNPINNGFYQISGYGVVGGGPDAGKNRWSLVQNSAGLASEIQDFAYDDWPTIVPTHLHHLTFYIAKVYILRNNSASDNFLLTIGSRASSYVTNEFSFGGSTGPSGSYTQGGSSTVINTSPHTIGVSNSITLVDSSAGTVLVRLPQITNSSVGSIYTIKDHAGSADVNGITIQDLNHSDIDGNNSIMIESAFGAARIAAYSGSSGFAYRIL